ETFWRLNRIVRIIEAPLILQECFNPIFTASLFLSDPRYSCKDSTDAFWLRQAMLAHCSAIRFVHPSYAASVVVDAQPFTYSAYNPAGEEGDEIKLPAPFEGDGERKLVCVEALRERSKNGMAAVHAFCRFAQEKPGW